MIRRPFGRAGFDVSVLGLGGHEFLPNGASRGFNEDYVKATTAGYVWPGFGGDGRRAVVAAAYEAGITYFDATIDAEKEALGRNLLELALPGPVVIQTRPEGMCYRNNPEDEWNWRLVDPGLLRAEVRRLLGLIRRDRVDVLNLGFDRASLERDPAFLEKLAGNVRALKAEGLIRCASADTFAGEAAYLAAIATGAFDSLFINFNLGNDGAVRRVLPAAARAGMAVVAREAFMKTALFAMGREAGITDGDVLARVAVRWILAHPAVTLVVVGIDRPSQLVPVVAAAASPAPGEDDRRVLAALTRTRAWADYHAARLAEFSPAPA